MIRLTYRLNRSAPKHTSSVPTPSRTRGGDSQHRLQLPDVADGHLQSLYLRKSPGTWTARVRSTAAAALKSQRDGTPQPIQGRVESMHPSPLLVVRQRPPTLQLGLGQATLARRSAARTGSVVSGRLGGVRQGQFPVTAVGTAAAVVVHHRRRVVQVGRRRSSRRLDDAAVVVHSSGAGQRDVFKLVEGRVGHVVVMVKVVRRAPHQAVVADVLVGHGRRDLSVQARVVEVRLGEHGT